MAVEGRGGVHDAVGTGQPFTIVALPASKFGRREGRDASKVSAEGHREGGISMEEGAAFSGVEDEERKPECRGLPQLRLLGRAESAAGRRNRFGLPACVAIPGGFLRSWPGAMPATASSLLVSHQQPILSPASAPSAPTTPPLKPPNFCAAGPGPGRAASSARPVST